MRVILSILLVCSLSAAYAQQDIRVKRSIVDQALYLKDRWLEGVKNDTANISDADRSLMTAKAIYELVNARTGIPGPQGETGETGATGATGAAGADGSVWYEGMATPTGGLGVDGDFYLNRSNGYYYTKTAGSWTIRGSLMGSQGPAGPQGAAGIDGVNGANGATGPAGPKGEDGKGVTIKGSVADAGSLPGTGSPGDSWLVGDSLYVWDDSSSVYVNVGLIRGPQGDTGATGVPGSKWFDQSGTPNPATGVVGDFYINRTAGDYYEKTGVSAWTPRGTIRGPQGIQGIQGIQGATGATGAQGIQGIQGIQGAPGSRWYDGVGAPGAGLGANNDFYLNKSNGDYYLKASGAWSIQGNLKGPAGSSGGLLTNVNL